MAEKQIGIAVVGMGFGAEFAAIYAHHPNVRRVVICDRDEDRLNATGDRFALGERTTSFDALLVDDSLDAIHIVTGIPDHAAQTLAVLRSGRHCACTVPMATSLDDLHAIVQTVRETGLNYMMMETVVYERAFFWVQEQLRAGVIGDIQLLRGAHYQDMENWPTYWAGLPPMWYATHAVSPLLALAEARATEVRCYGSGTMREQLHQQYGNPYPIETATFKMAGRPYVAEVTRALFHSARAYTESFNVYGSEATFEWQQIWSEDPVIFRLSPLGEGNSARSTDEERVSLPDYPHRLPPEIAPFTRNTVYDTEHEHLSFTFGGGHGGSHPHLCHEFVRSIVEDRKPWPDEATSANWTAVGICAHQSAMQGGTPVTIPCFD